MTMQSENYPGTSQMSFPGPVGTKRRRMRSTGAAVGKTAGDDSSVLDDDDEKVTQTSKCKGVTTIPIFLKKTYKMIEGCDPSIASWSPDGDTFIVKDPERFADEVIPQYFDHNKFSSFARQLNFYGFRKMQNRPIKNEDFDAAAAKYITFFNENFKRGRCDLLKKIQRSTRGGTGVAVQDSQKEIQSLRDRVSTLEDQITEMKTENEERVRRLELEMLARMEQMVVALTNKQQQQGQQPLSQAFFNMQAGMMKSPLANQQYTGVPVPSRSSFAGSDNDRVSSTNSQASAIYQLESMNMNGFQNLLASNQQQQQQQQQTMAPPTLPPHPKQKQALPAGLTAPSSGGNDVDRISSLRDISLARGFSNLSRGMSDASAVLGSNWDESIISMLMNDEKNAVISDSSQLPTVSNGSSSN